jgi:hypothetical protein
MSPRSQPDRPAGVARRDASGGRTIGASWESVTERLIREAQERGEFDDLPGHGMPIRVEADPWAGDEALAFHVLRNARVAPPWIEADKEVRESRERVDQLIGRARGAPSIRHDRLRRELTELVRRHTAAVHRLSSLAPADRLHRRPLVLATVLDELETAFRAPPTDPSSRPDDHP